MVGAARRKVDTQTQQMFDPEVDKPEHDKILTRLFEDDEVLKRLFMDRHKITGMLQPFTEASTFVVKRNVNDYNRTPEREVAYAEAVQMTGTKPAWRDMHPIRIHGKTLEAMMMFSNEDGKYSRIIGFVDICVSYSVATMPYIVKSYNGEQFLWTSDKVQPLALIEVKSAWPTAGNLLRQLNLYSQSSPKAFGGTVRYQYVVGPDDSVNDLVNQHGWRVVTFDQALGKFSLVPGNVGRKQMKEVAGEF